MKYYDLHVHSAFSEGESTIDQLAQRAKELGYIGICFAEYYEGRDQLHKLKECVAEAVRKSGIEILLGFEARNEKELRKLADMRKMFDILLARGGDLKMNRAAVETREVDILTHPEHGRYDCGMNHVMARLAKKNNVAIELNFREDTYFGQEEQGEDSGKHAREHFACEKIRYENHTLQRGNKPLGNEEPALHGCDCREAWNEIR